MANRFIGGVLSSRPQANTPFSSRASTGTYFDSAGVMRTAPVNQPRLNYSLVGSTWTRPSVLIEPASTNFLTYSEDLSNGVWTSNNSITTNQTVAPDGATTADLVYPASTGSFQVRYQQNPTGTSTKITGYTFTVSIFAKAAGKSWLFLGDDNATTRGVWFNVSTGVIGTTGSGMLNGRIEFVGNDWYRCQVTYITNGVVRLLTAITDADNSSSVTASGTNGIHLWGAQLEERFTATSYIPTTTAGVTRAADVVGPGTSGIYNLEDRQATTAVDDQSTVQSFTSTGSTTWTAPADVTSVEVLVVAGGGGANNSNGGNSTGGGGGGGVIYNTSYPVVSGTTYPIVVGAGGTPAASNSVNPLNGSNSQFANLIAIGGGWGKGRDTTGSSGGNGGSGGGGDTYGNVGGRGISGQGYSGGNGLNFSSGVSGGGGGGGGAAGPGGNAIVQAGGVNGPGVGLTISGTLVYYGAGGVGQSTGGSNTTPIAGGTASNTNGAANTGAGGAGGSTNNGTSTGGSGIVVIKYKRTPRQISSTSNAALVVQKFSTTNLWTVPVGVTQVEALVVAGGGGGGYGRDVTNTGSYGGGGGGAGGLVYSSALTVTPGSTYAIGVGTGGLGAPGTTGVANQGYSGFGSGIGTGTELITNGSAFTVTTGWTATTATLSVPQTGTFRITPNASVNGTASQSITTVNGVTYVAVVKVTSDVAKFFRLRIGTTQNGNEITDFFTAWTDTSLDNGTTGSGFYSTTFTATGSTTWINMQIGGGTQQATDISYISVRQATSPAFGGGGGGGVSNSSTYQSGLSGGSGGGAGSWNPANGTPGTAVSGQGNAGGTGVTSGASAGEAGGGGGGAGSAGLNATFAKAGNGGTGLPYSITGNLEYYAGGGGGGSDLSATLAGQGGIGGGGGGNANGLVGGTAAGANGASNTGGGGGGGGGQAVGGNGGSGVVVLRYRVPQVAVFQDSGALTCPSGVTSVQALIVAGGGGGGYCLAGDGGGGGGGAGGLIYSSRVAVTPGSTYAIVVGQGGAPAVSQTVNGSIGANSNFANLIATGGGGGGSTRATGSAVLNSGGSGGGAGSDSGGDVGGSGTYGQGNAGGNNTTGSTGAGGGGAGSIGVSVSAAADVPNGGVGLAYSISGTSTTYAGGGGGGKFLGGTGAAGTGGEGGGGNGGKGFTGSPGLINTGGGGGGGGMIGALRPFIGGHGGSGIVIIRWIGG